jgi:hypothetical protein
LTRRRKIRYAIRCEQAGQQYWKRRRRRCLLMKRMGACKIGRCSDWSIETQHGIGATFGDVPFGFGAHYALLNVKLHGLRMF